MKWTTRQPDREGWWWAKGCKNTVRECHQLLHVFYHKNDDGSGYWWCDGKYGWNLPESYEFWSDEPVQEPEEMA